MSPSAVKKKKGLDVKTLELTSNKTFSGDALKETARILQTQVEHVPKTISRFLKELDEMKKKLKV